MRHVRDNSLTPTQKLRIVVSEDAVVLLTIPFGYLLTGKDKPFITQKHIIQQNKIFLDWYTNVK
jgi:hypothetical protein